MAATTAVRCTVCGGEDLVDSDDGHFYCTNCGAAVADIIDTGLAEEDTAAGAASAIYHHSHRRSLHPSSQPHHQTFFSSHLNPKPEPIDPDLDPVGPTQPEDFGEEVPGGAVIREWGHYFRVVRWRYLVGVQVMMEKQCEALVERFGVSPVVCGIAGSVWGRVVAASRVFEDGWEDKALFESESQGQQRVRIPEEEGRRRIRRYEGEPRNMHKERLVLVWCKYLKKTIPLSYSLAVSYLACHIAREPVLPTDILRWTVEGKLPYFAAFVEIEKTMEKLDPSIKYVEITVEISESIKNIMVSIAKPSTACPLSSCYMFRPSQAVPLQKLESMAASIAESLRLSLPPVNFYAIASRYLKQLSLPVGKIIPHACRIYEWSMPPDLWLSASELRLPTRVCVMSILIVAIRILYNINGFGKWEMTLSASTGSSSRDHEMAGSDPSCKSKIKDEAEEGSSSQGLDGELEESVHKFESDAAELLNSLEKRYDEVNDKYEYSKDLSTYLQYCKDVVFAGSAVDRAEETLIEQLWNFYQTNQEDNETKPDTGLNQKRSRNSDIFNTPPWEPKKHRDEDMAAPSNSGFMSQDTNSGSGPSSHSKGPSPVTSGHGENASQNMRERALRHMKIDMEEHRFCYIPPRVNVKRYDYLHYARKRDDGSLTYVAHADYYIVLRACAKAAQVDVRVMHAGVLNLERRLRWIEKRIDICLPGKFSKCDGKSSCDLTNEPVDLSASN